MPWIRLPSWPTVKPVWPLPPTSFCGCHPNALLLPSPPLSALHLVPVVLQGSPLPLPPLPIPCVPVMHLAVLLASSTSPGTPPPFGLSPTPFLPLLPPSSSQPCSPPCLRSGSRPAPIAPGIPWTRLIAAFTFPESTSWLLPPTLILSHLVPPSCLPLHLVPFVPPMFLGPMPLHRYLVPLFYAPYHTPSVCRLAIYVECLASLLL